MTLPIPRKASRVSETSTQTESRHQCKKGEVLRMVEVQSADGHGMALAQRDQAAKGT